MSIETPHMGRFKAQQVVRIHVVTSREGMADAIHSAIAEITTALQLQGVAPCAPWFAFHHRRPTDSFDFDVCFPVSKEIAASGRLENASLPDFEVVRTAYHGPYEGLPTAWPEFHRWVERHHHRITDQAIEQYSRGPRDVADPGAWQTDLMFVLAEGEVSKERLV